MTTHKNPHKILATSQHCGCHCVRIKLPTDSEYTSRPSKKDFSLEVLIFPENTGKQKIKVLCKVVKSMRPLKYEEVWDEYTEDFSNRYVLRARNGDLFLCPPTSNIPYPEDI